MKNCFDRILCDPPFLSTDCQIKGTKPWADTFLLRAVDSFPYKHSCNDRSVVIQKKLGCRSRCIQSNDHCMHRGADGKHGSEGLSRNPDNELCTATQQRASGEWVPLLRQFWMRCVAVALTEGPKWCSAAPFASMLGLEATNRETMKRTKGNIQNASLLQKRIAIGRIATVR